MQRIFQDICPSSFTFGTTQTSVRTYILGIYVRPRKTQPTLSVKLHLKDVYGPGAVLGLGVWEARGVATIPDGGAHAHRSRGYMHIYES